MNIIDEMANDALQDEYFLSLFHKAEKLYWSYLLQPLPFDISFSKDEYDDILTFADILSLSSTAEHRNLSIKIISCLKHFYENDAKYKYYSQGIMIRLGNFPGYKLLSTVDNADSDVSLPIDISIEKQLKEQINKDDYSDKIFTDAQYYMLNALLDKNHFSFSGPTSFGKSFILTSFIKSLMMNNKRGLNIVFLVPTRALVSQTLKKFKPVVDNMEGYFLTSSPDIPAILHNRDAHYIFVFTPERLLHYFSVSSNPTIEYVFVDEAQKVLSADTRSVVYYHAISLAERKSCKLFFSSPNISNVDIFLKLFNKTSSETKTVTESPVCQTRVFVDMIARKVQLFSDVDAVYTEKYQLSNSLPELIQRISENVDSVKPKSLIYCNTIDDTIECAKNMASHLSLIPSKELDDAADEIATFIHKDYYLVDFIRKGVGFHFGKLPQKVRDIVERLYENGDINYLFCTSTLLEGVNLPAQNIFILNNQIGNRNLQSIDFWNLAGRAGRLTKELCGNVICVRWTNKDGRWNTAESIEIIKNKKLESISTEVLTGKENFYKNILHAAQGQPFTRKSVTETERRVYNAFSNVLISHFFNDQPSLLRNELQKKEPDGVKILTEIGKRITISPDIICRFPLIKVQYQDDIWKMSSMFTPILEEPTYDNCLKMLAVLFDLYHWSVEESGGRNPLFPKGNKNFIRHYASLMTDWMNSKSINEILNQTLFNYRGKDIMVGYLPNGQIEMARFNPNNKHHINVVINRTISEIDTVIRFTLKNYFENYYAILEAREGKRNCGQDWALYMEHGTTKKELIEIQKLGVPRHLSKLFYDDFSEFFVYSNDGELVSLKTKPIYEKLCSGRKAEYKELLESLIDNYILDNKYL